MPNKNAPKIHAESEMAIPNGLTIGDFIAGRSLVEFCGYVLGFYASHHVGQDALFLRILIGTSRRPRTIIRAGYIVRYVLSFEASTWAAR
jgi:hypothetical protein